MIGVIASIVIHTLLVSGGFWLSQIHHSSSKIDKVTPLVLKIVPIAPKIISKTKKRRKKLLPLKVKSQQKRKKRLTNLHSKKQVLKRIKTNHFRYNFGLDALNKFGSKNGMNKLKHSNFPKKRKGQFKQLFLEMEHSQK